jgi:hypothetical protein
MTLRAGKATQLDAAGCRVKADEMRERAKTARDPVAHKQLLMLAEQYEILAHMLRPQNQR